MKNIISLLLCYCCLHAASAQDTLRIQPRERQRDERLQEIDIREPREVIKQELSSNQYSSWILQSAYTAPAEQTANGRTRIVSIM